MSFKNFILRNANEILALFIPLCFSDIVMADNFDDIFEIACRAPSSHNAQMWKCERISTSECIISIDTESTLKKVDSNNREAWISIGAFVDNCIKVASDLGYILNSKFDDNRVILTIMGTKEKENQYIPSIRQRHTDRRVFQKEQIPNIISESKSYIFIQRNSELGRLIANNIYSANVQQLNDKEKNKELAKWTITSHKEERTRKDGLSPSKLGLSKIQRFFFITFFNKKNINSKIFIKQALKGVRRQIDNCAGFIIIFSKETSLEEWFNSGRVLEELWLELTQKGISVHPMSQSIEERNYYTALKNILQEEKEIQMILRIGYPVKENFTLSKRKPIN